MMRFSVQQIKYDFLYAIREFDSDGAKWRVMTSDRPAAETLRQNGHDPDDFVFVGKPAGTDRAAHLVRDHMMQRFGVQAFDPAPDQSPDGHWVILLRSCSTLPHQPDLLEGACRV